MGNDLDPVTCLLATRTIGTFLSRSSPEISCRALNASEKRPSSLESTTNTNTLVSCTKLIQYRRIAPPTATVTMEIHDRSHGNSNCGDLYRSHDESSPTCSHTSDTTTSRTYIHTNKIHRHQLLHIQTRPKYYRYSLFPPVVTQWNALPVSEYPTPWTR